MNPSILTQKFLTGVVRAFPDLPLIGQEILPYRSIAGWDTFWDVLPRDSKLAPFVSVDGESGVADKTGISRVFHSVADIRQKAVIDESTILSLRAAGQPDVVLDSLAATRASVAADEIRRQLLRLTGRVEGRVEWMRWQALSTGLIAVSSGPVQFSVNFSIPADNIKTLASTARWSDTANSDPVGDMTSMIERIRAVAGRRPDRAYVGSGVAANLCANAKFRDLFKGSTSISQVLNPDTALDFLGTILNLTIRRYDASYQDDSGSVQSFLAANTVVMLPNPNQADGEVLGDVATAPAKANNFQPGRYAWTREEQDPWTTFVGVGIHAFPRIMHPDWIGIIKTCG